MTLTRLACLNVLRSRRAYAAYFLSSAFAVTVFYICALFIYHPAIQGGVAYDGAWRTLVSAACFMYLFALLFVLYSVRSFLRSRVREFGLLQLHGMTRRQLHRMIFLEQMLIGLAAVCGGLLAGLLSSKLFLMIGARLLGVDELAFYADSLVILVTAAAFALLFLAIAACTSLLLSQDRLADQLLAGRRSKTVPPYSRWLTAAALALLGAAYALAATADGASIYSRVVPVTAMAICGTYLFYTQAGAALIASLKRRKPLFWRGRHMIVIAGLAHRLHDHARMFFLVTILSAVMLCSVGFFASVTTIPEELAADYPAAVAYVAKAGHDSAAELARIEAELAARGIAAEWLSLPIQYVETSADRSVSRPLPLIGYRDYAAAMRLSSADIIHPPLSGTQALVMLGSQRDRTLLDVRSLHTYALADRYTLADQPLVLQEIGYTDTVILPDHLANNRAEPSIGEFSGLVVADELMDLLRDDSARERYTGYYVADLRQTAGLAAALADQGLMRHEEAAPYALAVSGTLLEARSGLYGTMLFIALLMGGVVFLAAGSFLYFRLYAELEYDRRQYETLLRLGMTEGELRRIVTLQIGWLFFVPFGLAIVHSGFAFLALQQIFYLSVADRLIGVLAGFIAAQVLYFLFIRNRYWRHLRRAWH